MALLLCSYNMQECGSLAISLVVVHLLLLSHAISDCLAI